MEFAVTITAVLIAVFGILEVGFIFVAKRGIEQGVNATARWVAVNSGATATTTLPIFVSYVTLPLGTATANACTISTAAVTASTSGCVVNLICNPTTCAVGGTVTITAQYTWVPFTTLVKIASFTLLSRTALTILN